MLPEVLLATCSSNPLAMNLYVASYAGNITTLSLLQNPDSTYNLTQTFSFNASTHNPSWLTLDRQNNVLYMIDEANEAINATNGTVVSYHTDYTGKLTEIQRVDAIVGGLHATIYGSGSALAVPH
jgi:6-phosphogluconolactonase (cycloisomerase 2 family)